MPFDERPRATTETLQELKIGTRLVEDYVVERILGVGGMGQVYLVRGSGTGKQFAVKRTLQRDSTTRRKFLAELQTWVNLPEHPNLVACRFFRTVGDEVLLFSDFVDGGSLSEWIGRRQLASLEQILDTAIQIARGLQAVHEARVVHQDVKPSNVLLGSDGLVRVADFGLARFRQREESQAGSSRAGGAGGLTRAYCSPEQAAGRCLTRQTDVWSWGVTVLDMFTGEVTWESGVAAGEALKEYQAAGAGPGLPAMPEALGNVLRRCFRKNPDDRWETMAALAGALATVARRATGREYEEPAPRVRGRPRPAVSVPSRPVDRVWTNPRYWLIEALQAEGKSLDALEGMLPAAQQTRRAQAVADLAASEKARVVLLRLVKAGRAEFLPTLACLYLDQAVISEHAGDHVVAGRLRDQVIKIYGHLVEGKGDRELAGELARAFESKALAEQRRGQGRQAVALYAQARAAREKHCPA
jgi:serine/threonine protein kinase